MPKPRRERRRVCDLKAHPKQSLLFDNLSEDDFAALKADIAANGMHHRPEVLPDNTVVTGHQRVQAAEELGWEEIEVVVRYDLANADDTIVESYLITDNLHRRQLSPLAQARVLQRLWEIANKRPHGRMFDDDAAIGTELATVMGMSRRNAARYVRVLETPREVQDAFDSGELPLTLASRVASLDWMIQERIARRISDGEDAKQVVREALRPDGLVLNTSHPVGKLIGALSRYVGPAREAFETWDGRASLFALSEMKEAHELINDITQRLSNQLPNPRLEQFLDTMSEEHP